MENCQTLRKRSREEILPPNLHLKSQMKDKILSLFILVCVSTSKLIISILVAQVKSLMDSLDICFDMSTIPCGQLVQQLCLGQNYRQSMKDTEELSV